MVVTGSELHRMESQVCTLNVGRRGLGDGTDSLQGTQGQRQKTNKEFGHGNTAYWSRSAVCHHHCRRPHVERLLHQLVGSQSTSREPGQGITDAPLWDTDKHARDSVRLLFCRPRYRHRRRHVRQLPLLLRWLSAHPYRQEMRYWHGSAVLHVDAHHGAGDREGGARPSPTHHGRGWLLDRGTGSHSN